MITIDLVRHGNTFDKTHPDAAQRDPVWCGSRTDLPLVPSGILQAVELGQQLRAAGVSYDTIYAGPLKRTQQAAQIIAHLVSYPLDKIITTDNLLEMDYGTWEGVNDKQTKADFPEDYANWNENRIAPAGAGFTPRETLAGRVQQAYDTAVNSGAKRVLCVTSNGLMSYFAAIVSEAKFEQMRQSKELKVGTGCLCQLQVDTNGTAEITLWNKKPSEITPTDLQQAA